METAARYVGVTLLLWFLAFAAGHIFIPELLSTELCFKWLLIMLGMSVYLVTYYIIVGDKEHNRD